VNAELHGSIWNHDAIRGICVDMWNQDTANKIICRDAEMHARHVP
jgi:hypothetical protein